MKCGSKRCCFCGSRFTFEDYELEDSMPADPPCEGCIRLYAILEESARRLAGSARLRAERDAALGRKGPQQDLSPAAILARLRGDRPSEQEQFDPRMAAAGKDSD